MIKQILKNLLGGFVIGIANVIPGVSGGTMAVATGLYDRMIDAFDVKNIKKNFWKKVIFLINVGIGVGIGVLLFANIITFLYDNFPIATNFAFIGLILGCLPLLFKKTGISKKDGVSFTKNVIPFVAALAVMLALAWLKSSGIMIDNGVQTELTPILFVTLFAGSFVGTIAMILPGISGSLLLLVFGIYPTIIQSIADLNIPLMIPNGIGCALGLMLGARLMNGLLTKYPRVTYSLIFGLVVGSLAAMYPGFAFNWEGLAAVLVCGGCAVGAYFLGDK